MTTFLFVAAFLAAYAIPLTLVGALCAWITEKFKITLGGE